MTDTERLDWCEKHLGEVMPEVGEWTILWVGKDNFERHDSGKTLRLAIEAGMQREREIFSIRGER